MIENTFRHGLQIRAIGAVTSKHPVGIIVGGFIGGIVGGFFGEETV